MTATTCAEGGCDGFSRGTANQGWAGSKMIIFEFEMPDDATSLPAIWGLNAQVVRAAQYGCNCRGMGGDGGCGELDIAETLAANSPQAITELYSFKGATGSGDGNFFPRPVGTRATLAVVLDVKTDAIAIVRLTDFDFSQAQLTRTLVDGLLGAPAMQVPFGANKRRSERPHPLRRRLRQQLQRERQAPAAPWPLAPPLSPRAAALPARRRARAALRRGAGSISVDVRARP